MNINIKNRVLLIASLVALFWIIELIDIATGNKFGMLRDGVRPR